MLCRDPKRRTTTPFFTYNSSPISLLYPAASEYSFPLSPAQISVRFSQIALRSLSDSAVGPELAPASYPSPVLRILSPSSLSPVPSHPRYPFPSLNSPILLPLLPTRQQLSTWAPRTLSGSPLLTLGISHLISFLFSGFSSHPLPPFTSFTIFPPHSGLTGISPWFGWVLALA